MKLDFFPPSLVNGVQTAEVPASLIEEAESAWSSSVIYYSLSLKLGAEGVRRYAQKNWSLKGELQVFQRTNGFMILKFAIADDRNHVLQAGP